MYCVCALFHASPSYGRGFSICFCLIYFMIYWVYVIGVSGIGGHWPFNFTYIHIVDDGMQKIISIFKKKHIILGLYVHEGSI